MIEFGHNGLGGLGPDERFGAGIVVGEISIDGGLQVGDRAEDAAADALPRHLREEALGVPERLRGDHRRQAAVARVAGSATGEHDQQYACEKNERDGLKHGSPKRVVAPEPREQQARQR